MTEPIITIDWEAHRGKSRVKQVRIHIPAERAQTEGDVTLLLSEREADMMLTSYVKQLRSPPVTCR